MKKLLFLFLVAIFMVSCNFEAKETIDKETIETTFYSAEFSIYVIYMNGDEDTLTFVEDSLFRHEVLFELDEGDLIVIYDRIYDDWNPNSWRSWHDNKTLASGVRRYGFKGMVEKMGHFPNSD